MEFKDALKMAREIPDFPKPGILFLDITPILSDAAAFSAVIEQMAKSIEAVDICAGIEARGFILAAALAAHSKKGFVPFRKSGKLPHQTYSAKYGLEYGADELELHIDAFSVDDRVLIIDDVLATGGTLIAADKLSRSAGFEVAGALTFLEIEFLKGSALLNQHQIINRSVLKT
jgi:adenine phosphoribosyltransferase